MTRDQATAASPWHGWSVNGVAYHVGRYPTRKAVTLSRAEGATSAPAAYFRTEGDALAFLGWLDKLALTTNIGVQS